VPDQSPLRPRLTIQQHRQMTDHGTGRTCRHQSRETVFINARVQNRQVAFNKPRRRVRGVFRQCYVVRSDQFASSRRNARHR
jgi:hypothetical protein